MAGQKDIRSFEVDSMLGISVEIAEMERPLSQVSPFSVLPEKMMAPILELKENGVTLRFEGDDVGSIEVA